MKVMKYDALATVAALGSAFAIFQSFDAFVDFCSWLQPLVFYWRYYIYLAFDYVFFWLPFVLPASYKDTFAAAILIGGIVLRSSALCEQELRRENSDDLSGALKFYFQTVLFSCGAVLIFFLAPVFGWVPSRNVDFGSSNFGDFFAFLPVFVKIVFSVGVFALIILISDDAQGNVRRAVISQQMWRIIIVIATLLIINQIGLLADELRPINELDFQPLGLEG